MSPIKNIQSNLTIKIKVFSLLWKSYFYKLYSLLHHGSILILLFVMIHQRTEIFSHCQLKTYKCTSIHADRNKYSFNIILQYKTKLQNLNKLIK